MKPELTFCTASIKRSRLCEEACVPDLVGSLILQNDLVFDLDEEDEIYEGYGKRTNSYPYRQYLSYSRKLTKEDTPIAVLENDYILAVFLPGFGGRLWELIDKKTGKNLLYTNDVIRFSNLSVRNAWFSGGVEWNLGVIGHSPLTLEEMYTARLKDNDENPVLRMYAYERIREVEYQMDFWLGEKDEWLNCRMRIVNAKSEVVPMYWWSNMAVPEYQGGRIVVPAQEAFTSRAGQVYKVSFPEVEGVDVSRYTRIPEQVDYFFHIPEKSPKYIANLDASGYGLLHMSTGRLRGRKLFSWGKMEGSDRWQEFLTEDAGRYVEIQAGLGKTQYGCIPMPPHSAWEWIEQYGPVHIPETVMEAPFEILQSNMTDFVCQEMEKRKLEQALIHTKKMAKSEGKAVYMGCGHGALMRVVRMMGRERNMTPQLYYGELTEEQKIWADFLEEGKLPERENVFEQPEDFQCSKVFYDKLLDTISNQNRDSWYAHYHLGLMHLYYEKTEEAQNEFTISLKLKENPWAFHARASVSYRKHNNAQCVKDMNAGLTMYHTELSYVKEGFRLLLMSGGYDELIALYEGLLEQLKSESRVLFCYITALSETGEALRALELLNQDDGLELVDLREGEDSLYELYASLYEKVNGRKPEKIPHKWNFHSM